MRRRRIKPKFEIADKIERYKPEFHEWCTYAIRIENSGDYDIEDVRVRLRFRRYPEQGKRVTITYPLLQDDLFYLASWKDKEDSYWNVTFTTGGIDGAEFAEDLQEIFPNEDSLMDIIKLPDYDLRMLLDYFDHIQFLVRGVNGFDGKHMLEKRVYKKEDIVDVT